MIGLTLPVYVPAAVLVQYYDKMLMPIVQPALQI